MDTTYSVLILEDDVRYAVWLEQLDAPAPEDRESLGDRWWRWVLVHCGVARALAWTVWVERGDRWLL